MSRELSKKKSSALLDSADKFLLEDCKSISLSASRNTKRLIDEGTNTSALKGNESNSKEQVNPNMSKVMERIEKLESILENKFMGLFAKIEAMKNPMSNTSFVSANDKSILSEICEAPNDVKDKVIDKKLDDIIKNPKKSVEFVVPKKISNTPPKNEAIDDDELMKLLEESSQKKRKSTAALPAAKKLAPSNVKSISRLSIRFEELMECILKTTNRSTVSMSLFSNKNNGSNSITFESAFNYKIPCICSSNSKCNICLDMRTLSNHRLFELINKTEKCTDKELFSIRYALVVWKLASLERRSSVKLLNLPTALLQFQKGLSVYQSKKMPFQDMPKHYVVLVCSVIKNENSFQLLLTNGFHTIMTEEFVNAPKTNIGLIYDIISKGKIKPGMKLHISNSESAPYQTSSKFVSIKNAKIILNYNGLSLAHKTERLGRKSYPLIKSVSSIRMDSNMTNMIDVVIIKKYPILIEEGGKSYSLSAYFNLGLGQQSNKKAQHAKIKYYCMMLCMDTVQLTTHNKTKYKKSTIYIKFEANKETELKVLNVSQRIRIANLTSCNSIASSFKYQSFVTSIANVTKIEQQNEVPEQINQKYCITPTLYFDKKIGHKLSKREVSFRALLVKYSKPDLPILYENKSFYLLQLSNKEVCSMNGFKEGCSVRVENALLINVTKNSKDKTETISSPKSTDFINKLHLQSTYALCFHLESTTYTVITKCDDKISNPKSDELDMVKVN